MKKLLIGLAVFGLSSTFAQNSLEMIVVAECQVRL